MLREPIRLHSLFIMERIAHCDLVKACMQNLVNLVNLGGILSMPPSLRTAKLMMKFMGANKAGREACRAIAR